MSHPAPLAESEDEQPDPYLTMIGQRVRRVRAQRGMSRRILSQACGVSERYLAQLEAGKGNASILVLRAIAAAMGVAVDDLVDTTGERPVEYALLRERLRSAPRDVLRRLVETLNGGSGETAKRPWHIALVGLRGAGKSTLGAALAKRAGAPFIELVQEIEREAGMAVSEIFAHGGQVAYRRVERAALDDTLARFERAVIALGGSLVSQPETYQQALNSCYTVWLSASPEAHMARVTAQGDHRPMADNRHAMADLKRILEERRPLYERADASIDTTDSSVEQSLRVLIELAPVTEFVNERAR